MTLAMSLESYLKNLEEAAKRGTYEWRCGVAIASVHDLEDWPYSMIIGLTKEEFWHPELMDKSEIADTLQRMHRYQKKQNMLCLQDDIDALFYESIMEVHRQSKEQEQNKTTE